ncbi:MAG TPA: aminoacyl-tRNA deacylase [Actinomycetales bacterium]|nr:aminoacyl-tRNA deacylase [Actinomycetales bacterium]
MSRQGTTPATTLLAATRTPHTVHTYAHDSRAVAGGLGYGAEAAAALGVDPVRVLKTLVVSVHTADVRDRLGVAVLPVGARLDLRAVAAALDGRRAALADGTLAARTTGYVVGGISPLGQRKALPTVVDVSALEHATVLVSGGRRGLEIELSPGDLVTLTAARVAPVTAGFDHRSAP